jgi:hypothetical protein
MAAAKEKVSIGHFDGHATSHEAVGKLRVVRECENRLTEFLKNVFQLASAMPQGANLDRPSTAWTDLCGHDQRYLGLLVSFNAAASLRSNQGSANRSIMFDSSVSARPPLARD